MIDVAAPLAGRPRFRAGGRKNNAKDCDYAVSAQVHMSLADNRMMRISENIHATYPLYATLAPILHRSVRKTLTERSTTLSNGAADADGR